jgi:putative ABC transport system permease protein
MSVVIRGIKNAFRNWIRTLSVVLILAISIGLALVMYLAHAAVGARIDSVKSSIGNVITVTPAGSQGFEGGGEPLTASQLVPVKSIAHVVSVNETLNERLETDTNTNLTSAIEPGTLGNRRNGQVNVQINNSGRGGSAAPRDFKLPIILNGISDISSLTNSTTTSVASGTVFAADSTENVAAVGKELAAKNNLSVDSTFTANEKTVKVVAIFDSGSEFANNTVYMPIAAVQAIMNEAGQISTASITVDSIDNMDAALASVKSALGTDKADVTSSKDTATQAVEPLTNIQNISLYSLIGALVAGAVITLLTMIMIVRERRREIGVLKAIGASNISIVTQFISESLVLTLMASVVGIIAGVFLSNPVLSALVSSSSDATGAPRIGGGPTGSGGGFRSVVVGFGPGVNFREALTSLQAHVGPQIVLYGIGAALVIAIVGSAIPAFLISKIRPAEVIRGE